jgi:hypothetical protein
VAELLIIARIRCRVVVIAIDQLQSVIVARIVAELQFSFVCGLEECQ